VGTGINISHGGATLLGMPVDITVAVTAVEGRKVTFSLVARDGAEEISRGEHSRFVIQVEKLRAKLAAKAAQPA
jgi:fluoroacetyl-CoA thioesterase